MDEVFETTFFFMMHESPEIQNDALHSLGLICIRHHSFMLESKLKTLYIDILNEDFYSVQHKIKVLNNLESYLMEEDVRMRRLDDTCKLPLLLCNVCSAHYCLAFPGSDYQQKEDLKEMGDVTSGMASTVIQVYLKSVLDSFINPNALVRHAVLKIISLILAQGLVYPVQIVPYLICMSTDREQKVGESCGAIYEPSI